MIDTTANLVISKSNEVFLKINTEPHIEYELRDHFKFEVPNAKFMPQYRGRNWNGEIHLFDMRSKQIYVGLLDKIVNFCEQYGYSYKFEDNKFYGTPYEENEHISMEGVKDYMNSICAHTPRKYQIEGVYGALKHNRKLLISPTASGKSLMIYSLVRYYVDRGEKILLVVPTTSLVEQMYKDFLDYGWDADSYCHRIYSGREKSNDAPVTITTWQSVYKLERSFFEDYGCIIGDEAHLFKSKSLIQIMTKLHHAKYRFGFTGTLDGTQTHKLVLEGLFGPAQKVISTKELMDSGTLADFKIKILAMKYHDEIRKIVSKMDYQAEMDFLVSHEGRNKFIKNLALSLEGNTLLLFQYVEKHGKPLFNLIRDGADENRKVFFISGDVATSDREAIRGIVEKQENSITVASLGTFSTGINIRNLHNIVFASPSKSQIRVLQSIGRGLRKTDDGKSTTLYDIIDDIIWKSRKNFGIAHADERLRIYGREKFNHKTYRVDL